jgi:hypothetical protein
MALRDSYSPWNISFAAGPSVEVFMKYFRSCWVFVSVVVVAWRMAVFVKPEPRLDVSKVQVWGSVGRLRACRIEVGTGDIVAVVWIIRVVVEEDELDIGVGWRCQHE